jgi:hypothetical protein
MENQHHPSPEEASSEVVFPSLPIEHVGLIVGSLPHSETQKMRLVSRTMDEVSFVASWCSSSALFRAADLLLVALHLPNYLLAVAITPPPPASVPPLPPTPN